MAERKHRMLYQDQDPYQRSIRVPLEGREQRALSLSPSEPPTYDYATGTTPAQAHLGYDADRWHRMCCMEDMPYLKVEVPQRQAEPEETEESSHVQGRLAGAPPVRNFFTLTPQPKLGSQAVDIMCPACGQQGVTRLHRSPHSRTHVAALWLCTFGWCCCACLWPYMLNCCQKTSHYCSACQIFLGAYYPQGC